MRRKILISLMLIPFLIYCGDNWQSKLGYGLGTATSLGVGLLYGNTETKIAGKALGYAGKGIERLGRMCNFTAKEVKAASNMEDTAAKISREITPKIERSVKDVVPKNSINKRGVNPFN